MESNNQPVNPSPIEPKKNWFMRHEVLYSVIGVLVLVVIAGCVYLWKAEKQTNESLQQANQNNTSNTRKPDPYWANKNIPAEVKTKAVNYIISKVGKDFFDKNVTVDMEHTALVSDKMCQSSPSSCADYLSKPHYYLSYDVQPKENPDAKWSILIMFDDLGNMITDREPEGIPDCVSSKQLCEFPITKQEAIDLAKNAGLEQGISKNWSVQFQTPNKLRTSFVWEVSNTLSADQDSIKGKRFEVNANTGEVIGTSNWFAIP